MQNECSVNTAYTMTPKSCIARVRRGKLRSEIVHSGSRSSPPQRPSFSIAALTGMGLTSQKSAPINS